MEIVLLWLDELDDLVFAGLARRRQLLHAALAAALLALIALTSL
jgi:hypothetical protein